MSDLLNCDECGHVRYADGDLFNGLCVTCEQWAEDQIVALRAEVAALKADLNKSEQYIENDLLKQVAALKAMYEEPLTEDEACRVVLGEYRETMNDWDRDKPALELAWDAAIRKVRQERGTK